MPDDPPVTIATLFASLLALFLPVAACAERLPRTRPLGYRPGLAIGRKACSMTACSGGVAHGPARHEFRHLSRTLPSGRREPDTGAGARRRADRVARPPRLRRGMDRRAPFRRLGADRRPRAG